MKAARAALVLLAALSLAACRTLAAEKPIPPVAHVNLKRYVGRWYVIAAIPTHIERDDYNPVENYRLEPDGSICTVFRFRRGSFTSRLHTVHSTATVVRHTGNAEWHVHLFWLLRLQYIVAWLSPHYNRVIVARDARDYVWLMARTPQISRRDYAAMVAKVAAMGYPVSKLRKSPQRWPEPGGPRPSFASICR
ncbi:MAG: lipocalin family protein [Gammaproteobacteria bacterium]|nr:lipocalin family protein [Gammaproteobacteria bacterium]